MADNVEIIDVESYCQSQGGGRDESKEEVGQNWTGPPPASISRSFNTSKYSYSSSTMTPSGYHGELFHISTSDVGAKLQSVPEDRRTTSLEIQSSAGGTLSQFLKLVRVGTEVSTASTEIVSNTSPVLSDPAPGDKHQLNESSMEAPKSPQADKNPSGLDAAPPTPDPVDLGEAPVTPKAKRPIKGRYPASPGDCSLARKDSHPMSPGLLSERDVSPNEHDISHVVRSIGVSLMDLLSDGNSMAASTSQTSEGASADSITQGSQYQITNGFIRRERIRRNVKLIGKMMKETEATSNDDEFSCSASQMNSKVIDLTMHEEEEQVLLCLLSTDSGDAGYIEAQSSVGDSTLTTEFGNTRVTQIHKDDDPTSLRSIETASEFTLPSGSSLSVGSSSIEFWRSSLTTQNGGERKRKSIEKNSDKKIIVCDREKDERSSPSLTEILSLCLASNYQEKVGFSSEKKLTTSAQAPPLAEISVPKVKSRGRSRTNRVDRVHHVKNTHSDCRSCANESGRMTPQSFFGWSFRSNFFVSHGSSDDEDEEEKKTNYDGMALLRPASEHPDDSKESESKSSSSDGPSSSIFRNLWESSTSPRVSEPKPTSDGIAPATFQNLWKKSTPSISETAADNRADLSSSLSPLSLLVSPLSLFPTGSSDVIPVESVVDEENNSVDNHTSVKALYQRRRLPGSQNAKYPKILVVGGLVFCFLLMLGIIALVFIGLELSGNDFFVTRIHGDGTNDATTTPTLSPASPRPSLAVLDPPAFQAPEENIFSDANQTSPSLRTRAPSQSPAPTRAPTTVPAASPKEAPTAWLVSRTSVPTMAPLESTNATQTQSVATPAPSAVPSQPRSQPQFLWASRTQGKSNGDTSDSGGI